MSLNRQAYWSEQNSLWESSGLAQPKFCEQQGLVYKQFVYWRGRLNKKTAKKAEPRLLKVSTTPAHELSQAKAASAPCLEVILPTGIKLYIKAEADISKASALIQLNSRGPTNFKYHQRTLRSPISLINQTMG